MKQKSLKNSFLFSLVFHLLLLLLLTCVITLQPTTQKQHSPNLYLPSYVYTGGMKPSMTAQAVQHPIEATHPEKSMPQEKYGLFKKSVLQMSQDVLRHDQAQAAMQEIKNEEPILLVGDMNEIVDPLIKLMGRSLSAHFKYPEMEGRMGMRGRVLVKFILHPEGYYSDVQIVRSSENQDFDSAALYAINSAPPIQNAKHFLQQPKRFLVGFIFN